MSMVFSESGGILASLSPLVVVIQSVAFDQAMDRAQVTLRVAFATRRFVHLSGVAMRFDVGGIAFERPLETQQRILVLFFFSIEEAELQVHVGACGNYRRR